MMACLRAQDVTPVTMQSCRSMNVPATAVGTLSAKPADAVPMPMEPEGPRDSKTEQLAETAKASDPESGEPEVAPVRVFVLETRSGETAVAVERSDGKKWRFMRNAIDFELCAQSAELQEWLAGLVSEQLPGLLTLLGNEVQSRGAALKAAEKERDTLRGTEDYSFFGLDGESCTEKDIDRAYRQQSTRLHPDKGGDEESFTQMREKYEQLKSLRGESKRKEGGSIKWDAKSRESMLPADSTFLTLKIGASIDADFPCPWPSHGVMAGPGSGVDGRTRPGFKWKSARNTAPSGSDAAKPVQQPAQESAAQEAEMPHLPPTEAPEIPVQAAFANGEMVEIIGLQGALDLNGRVGIVREFDPASRRHRVELLEEDGSVRQVRVRPANLDLLSAEEFMPSCASKKKPPTVSKDPATLRPSQPVRTSHEDPEMAVALANAVNQCDLFQVQALLRDRADPNGHSQSPGTPLLLEAAAKTAAQSLDLAALLLGYNADPDAVLDRCRSAKAVRLEKEVETLCQIFRSKSASTEEERTILSKLDAGALAQARRLLKLSGPFALGGIAPAVCLEESSSCQELEATKAHRLFLHSADGLRPVLVMRPSAGQPSALVVLLHGLFQSARMLETTVRRLSDSVPHMLFVMPTAPTRDGWSVGPAVYCYGGYSLPVVGHCTLACSARRFNLMALYNMGFHDAKLAWGNWDYVDLSHFSNIPPGGELRTSAVMFVKECREKAHPPGLFASVASFTAGIALHRMWHHQKKSEKVTIPRLVELPNRKACSEVPPSNWALPLVLKCSGAAVLVMAASRKVRKRIWKGARLLDLKERNVSRASSTPSEAPSPVPVAPAHSVDGSVWREAVGGAPHPRVQEAPTCIPWTSQNVHVRAAPAVPAAGADKGDKPVRDGKPQADKTVASMKPEAEEADKIPPPAVKPAKPEAEETPPPVDVKPEVDKIPSTDVKPEAEETPPMDVKPEVDTSLESKAMLNEGASKGKGPQGKGPPLKGKGKGKMPSQSPPEGKGSTGKAAIRALVEAAKQQTELPEPRNRKWSAPKSTGTSLLDTSRATNLAIMLKKLPVCPAEFCECVKMLDSSHSQIAVGHVELVLANMPSQSEAHKLLSYDGNEGPLRDVEAEVLPLCSLSASAVKVFKIAMEHEDVYARHMARCRTISNAAQEVCRSRELRELLTLILHTGKYINSGAPGANAAETFTVESLQSLSTFKIGPISALHFLCISFRGMKREFLQLLLSNLRHVHAAAKEKFGQLDVDIHSSFQDDVKAVENRLEQVKQEVREQCHYERLAMLATQMTSELAALRTSFASAKQLVAEAQAYCDGAPRESMPAELFFQHVATFLGIFQATWEEIDAQPAKWRKYLSEAVTASALSNDITAWAQQLARQSIKDKHEVPQTSSEADISSSGHAFSDVSSVSNAEAKKLKFPAMNFVGIHADQANHSPLPSNLPTRSPSPTLRAQVQIAITPEESRGVQRLSSSHIRKIRKIAATDLFTTFAIHSPAQKQVPAVKVTGQRGIDGSHTDLGESKQWICRGAVVFLVSVLQWAKWGNIAIRISGSEQSDHSRWWRQGFILGKQRIFPCGFTTPELQFTGTAWFDHTRSARKAEALEECRSEILALLSSQGHEWGITPERVVLAGFSMGGTLAAWTALQVPRPLAGLLLFGTEGLSFTGGWAAPKTLDGPGSDWAVGAESLQVLQCHGREDTLCPIGSATTCADELRRLGCSVRALAFQGVGHALSTDMVDEAKLWLQKQLPALET
eukprot:s3908_g3.t2